MGSGGQISGEGGSESGEEGRGEGRVGSEVVEEPVPLLGPLYLVWTFGPVRLRG